MLNVTGLSKERNFCSQLVQVYLTHTYFEAIKFECLIKIYKRFVDFMFNRNKKKFMFRVGIPVET